MFIQDALRLALDWSCTKSLSAVQLVEEGLLKTPTSGGAIRVFVQSPLDLVDESYDRIAAK